MAGGLASTSTIPRSEAWRLGQCRPGDSLKLKRISWASALEMRQRTEKYIDQVRRYIARECSAEDVRAPDPELVGEVTDTILHTIPADQGNNTVEVKFRQVSPVAPLDLPPPDHFVAGWGQLHTRHLRSDDCGCPGAGPHPAPTEPPERWRSPRCCCCNWLHSLYVRQPPYSQSADTNLGRSILRTIRFCRDLAGANAAIFDTAREIALVLE